jgi:hypothetical protein
MVKTNRRNLLVAAAAALVVGGPLLWVVIVRDSSDGTPGELATSRADVDLGFPAPEQDDTDADRAYLAAEGRLVLFLHEQAAAVGAMDRDRELTPELCQETAARLDRDAPADEVLARIGGLTDPVLREAFHTERTALGVALTACISGEEADDQVPDIHEAVQAVNARLAEMGLD